MSPAFAIYFVWSLWLVVWVAFWFAVAIIDKREPGTLHGFASALFHIIVLVAYAFLLALISPFPGTDLHSRLWPHGVPDILGWALLAGVVAGFIVFIWASLHRIARLKRGDGVVDGGPYAVVRHPIYISSIFAVVLTAILFGLPTSALGAAIIVVALIIKVVVEEHTAEDDSQHDYRQRVPMFVPFWPKRQD